MIQKIDKKDLKNPDVIQGELQKGFQWTTSHSNLVGGIVVLVLVVWGGLLIKGHFDQKNEEQIQAQFFKAEKSFIEKKEKFEKALANEKAPKDKKQDAGKGAESEKLEKASGDLVKDFGPQMDEFAKIVNEHPNTNAAQMAALHFAETQIQYNKAADAEVLLKKVSVDKKSILSALVLKQLGTAQANQNRCQDAIQTWSKVLSIATAKAIHADVKLNQGLCFESLNDLANAEKMYTEAKISELPNATSKTAEKYLKLLQSTKK